MSSAVPVTGNALAAHKAHISRVLAASVQPSTGAGFAQPIAARLVLADMGSAPRDGVTGFEARVVVESVVREDMTNGSGTIHGACSAFLIDMCTTLALVLHSLEQGGAGAPGVTQSLNVVYHAPAFEGTPIKIVSTSLSVGAQTMSGKCEIWDTEHKRLVASGMQVKTLPPPKAKM